MRYDFAEVLAHCGNRLTRNKLARWCDAGIIHPDGGGSPGKRREFSFRNVIEADVCNELHGLNVTEEGMRRITQNLNILWDQPDDPINHREPDGPKNRDATILWIALQHHDDPIGDSICTYPVTPENLISRLTDGAVGGSGVAESGIALPIGRIIADLERATGDVFDADAALRKAVAAALAKHFGDGTDQDK